MAQSKARAVRLVADPSIGVSDLLSCWESFLDELGHNNLHQIIQPPPNTSWKTAPQPGWLARLSSLWTKFLGIASNGVVPSKKHRTSLEKLQDKRPVNKDGKRSREDYAERIDEWVRIGLSQLREIKKSELTKSRCFRKADAEEQAKLEEALALLQDQEEAEPSTETVTSKQEDQQTTQAVVPYEEPPPLPAPAQPPKETSIDPMAVFTAVMARPSLDDSPRIRVKSSRVDAGPSTTSSPQKFQGFLEGLVNMGAVESADESLLFSCANQKPINTGFSSQLARSNHEVKKQNGGTNTGQATPKGKAKPKPKPNQSQKKKTHQPQQTPEDMKNDKQTTKQAKKKKTHQHQQAPEDMKNDKQTTKPTKKKKKGKKKKKTPVVPPKVQEKKEETHQEEEEQAKETTVPQGFDASASRSLNRKRFTSRAWHQGFDASKADGLDDEASKARAREASQNASKQFDLLWPHPKKLKVRDVD